MTHFLTHTTDVQGNKYLVIKFDKNSDDMLVGFLDELKSHLGDDFDTFVSNQQARDLRDGQSHTHHITVVNVMDFGKVSDKLGQFMGQPIDDLKMLGIGTAKDDKRGNQTFFVVCQSDTLDNIRKDVGLKPHDFHITLGFHSKDVFGKSKSKDSLLNG
jgi:hypothetical protein